MGRALVDIRILQREYLLAISRALTAELDLHDVLRIILQAAVEIVSGRAGMIVLSDPNSETLRVAAPWQRVRRARSEATGNTGNAAVRLRREDFRVNRYQQRAATTTVFAVDASGSAALHRLAEAKGAVELLLAESYQRRDQVALVSFRGLRADLLLAPTRSLVRAKRSLAELPGGGGTPLAAGIRLALDIALGILRKGETPVVILLTDGRANVAQIAAQGAK